MPIYTFQNLQDPQLCQTHPEAIQEQARAFIAKTIRSDNASATQLQHYATTIDEIARANHQESHYWGSHWIVKKANSAEPDDDLKKSPGVRAWVPVGISSPKLRTNDCGTYRSVESVTDALRTTCRLVTNHTCDIHVHSGRMDGQPFHLTALKRLTMLLWMIEPILRTIRDPGSPNYRNIYTWGAELRQYSRLAKQLKEKEDRYTTNEAERNLQKLQEFLCANVTARNPTNLAALRTIIDAPDYKSLGMLLSGDEKQYRRLGFNFSAFGEEDDRAGTNPRTFEFRIMEGSMDSRLVLDWLRVCRAVVETAVAAGQDRCDRFVRVIGRLLEEGEETSVETLTTGERAGRRFRTLLSDLSIRDEECENLVQKVVLQN